MNEDLLSLTVHLECWLDVKQERKVGPALARMSARAGWDSVEWEKASWDTERRLFLVEGTIGLIAESPAAAVFTLLTQLKKVTNHCTISGPRIEEDGSLYFLAAADGRQVEAQSVVSLTAVISRDTFPATFTDGD